jgi:hypothetical protein
MRGTQQTTAGMLTTDLPRLHISGVDPHTDTASLS